MNRLSLQTTTPAKTGASSFWPWMLALAVLWFGNLQYRVLTDPDEGRYAEIPREMLASGDWLAPHLNGIQYLEKPPLQYWGTASLFAVLGNDIWVSRLWTAGLGFGLIWMTWRAGRRWYDEPAGRYAALILGSSLLFYSMAHVNTLDMGLTFFISAALIAFIDAQRALQPRRLLWVTWCMLGLAVLQKGLVGLVLPGFALALYVFIQRDWAMLRRLGLISGVLIVLAINLPWWWLMQRRNSGFVDWFFVHEHYTRFTTNEHGRSQPWWYFSALLLIGLLPWLEPVARGAVAGWHRKTAGLSVERLLLLWAAAVFIFYSPSGSKLAPYILPMVPPLALLAGRELSRAPAPHRLLRSSLILAALMALGLAAMPWIRTYIQAPSERAAGYAEIAQWGLAAGLVLGAAVIVSIWLLRPASRAAGPAVGVLATGMVASLALLSNGSNVIERWRGTAQIVAAVREHSAAASPLYCVDVYPQSVIYLLGRTCVVVGDHGELETQFDDGAINYLPAIDDFVAAWRREERPVAIIDAPTWLRLQTRSLPATVAFENSTTVVIVKRS
jgi:4-amino-4-deoxy-L-arabinose transferase-like glycosyltransferase